MWLLWRGIISAVCGSRLPTFLHEQFYRRQIPVLTHSFQQNQPTTVSQTRVSLAFNKLLAHQTVLITTGKQYKYHILYYTCKIDSFPLCWVSMPETSLIVMEFKEIILAAELQTTNEEYMCHHNVLWLISFFTITCLHCCNPFVQIVLISAAFCLLYWLNESNLALHICLYFTLLL